jgi:hypothetical protein
VLPGLLARADEPRTLIEENKGKLKLKPRRPEDQRESYADAFPGIQVEEA